MKASNYISKLNIFLCVLLGMSGSAYSQTSVFSYTGGAQTWTVPSGVTQLYIDASGAAGGIDGGDIGSSDPAKGGRVQAILSVTPGQVLNIYVGGQGGLGSPSVGTYGGFNGGGSAAGWGDFGGTISGGGGGGATDIRIGGTGLGDRILVAGGAGGQGYDGACGGIQPGGDGGDLIGMGESDCFSITSTGGTQVAGGSGATSGGYTSASDGTLGNGGANNYGGGEGGGGGGGYYGGGGGLWMGGAGGSSYTDPVLVTALTHTQGYNSTDGQLTLTVTNYAPTFAGSSPQTISLWMNGTSDISSVLAVNDPDEGQTLTWTVLTAPANGSLTGFPSSMTTTGGTITPSGLGYTANTGFTGSDAFTIMADDGNGGTATMTIDVTVLGTPSLTLGTMPSACYGSTNATLSYTGLSNDMTFPYTGSIQSWTVPGGISTIHLTAGGAQGGTSISWSFSGSAGGSGAIMSGDFPVTAGQTLMLLSGGMGGSPTISGCGGGGGGSFVWDNGTTTLFMAAGGGGGAGANYSSSSGIPGIDASTGNDGVDGNPPGSDFGTGGNGGILPTGFPYWASGGAGWLSNGNDGSFEGCTYNSTGGITPLGGGAGGTGGGTDGSNADGGFGGGGGNNGVCNNIGGGGGGGYSGGGGGAWVGDNIVPAGGGGGSFNGGSNQANSVGNTGNGMITISVTKTYSIVWDAAAHDAGFVDVTSATLSSSPISIGIPAGAPVATYNATMTISNGLCTSESYPITLTVKPIPTVDPVPNQSFCNGTPTTEIDFTGTVGGTTYNWTNDNTSIGAVASGANIIPAFTAANGTFDFIWGNITVTPVADGCTGTSITFTDTVKPTPDVNASSNQSVCNGLMTSYIPFTGDVAGTIFSWSNSDTTIGLASSGTGDIDSFMATNITPDPVTANLLVTTSANGCSGSSNSFTITVKPTPMLSSVLNPSPICDSTLFSYDPTSLTAGTLFSWTRDTVTGIANGSALGTDNPNEVLVNTTPDPISVTYVYGLYADGCVNTQDVRVTVNPRPLLSSTLTPPAICDSTAFNYMPTSLTSGTSYSWTRDSIPGITSAAGAGVDSVSEVLENITPDPIAVNYVFTLNANDCSNMQTVTVTVNPKPTLNTTLTPPSICDSATFLYVPGSLTTGTTFSWSRAVVTGISNAASSGVDTISEALVNTTPNPVAVTYLDTLRANGCMNLQRIVVTVNPTPRLSSTLTPPSLCDSLTFNYTPTSLTTGTAFDWSRAYVAGILLGPATGSGNPNEQMINTTHDNLFVTYVYTMTANGCSHVEDVTVEIHPTPTLSSDSFVSVCSGTQFNYYPTGYVFGSTFAWSRPTIPHISPAADTGSGNIHETLTDSLLTPVLTTYVVTLKANGCTHVQNVIVTINPTPPVVDITTHSPSTVCANTQYQNFGTADGPPAGQVYHWAATNGVVWATGSGGQYCLVSFPNPGQAVVTLESNIEGYTCVTNSSFDVNVGSSTSELPEVIYYNGQFMCLQNNMDSYQWGYDDDLSLDSTLISGEINPNYFNANPDFTYRHYWVLTVHNGCMQKSYYNAPTGLTTVNDGMTDVKVYPNPTDNFVNVDVKTTIDGNIEVQVLNLLGQKVNTTQAVDHKARIDVSGLPAGCYLIDCYREGVKIAAAKFIKN